MVINTNNKMNYAAQILLYETYTDLTGKYLLLDLKNFQQLFQHLLQISA
jgi:hypothetical protein